jgi:uncharacterized protein (DUF433 family)
MERVEEFFADYPDLTMADVQACLASAHKLVAAPATTR